MAEELYAVGVTIITNDDLRASVRVSFKHKMTFQEAQERCDEAMRLQREAGFEIVGFEVFQCDEEGDPL